MIDLTETIDRMFEAGRAGTQLRFGIFDKSVLLPLPQLLDDASHKAGRPISEAELRIMAGQGWLPLLPGAGNDGNEEGAPIYVPDRVGFFMKLQSQGYTTDELRVIADFEEFLIDNILAADDLAYVEDDLARNSNDFGTRWKFWQSQEQYLVPYFIASHPGSRVEDMIELAVFLKKHGYRPRQVQGLHPGADGHRDLHLPRRNRYADHGARRHRQEAP